MRLLVLTFNVNFKSGFEFHREVVFPNGYGKHIVTLFLPISKVVENSSNTFSMYLKISEGSVNIGEAQIRATISGQGLAAGLGDWNGRININENIGFVKISDVPFVADTFEDRVSVVFPNIRKTGISQTIGNMDLNLSMAFFINSVRRQQTIRIRITPLL